MDYEESGVSYRKYYNGSKNIPKMIYLDDLVIHDEEEMTVEEYLEHVRFERIKFSPQTKKYSKIRPQISGMRDVIISCQNLRKDFFTSSHQDIRNPSTDVSDDALVDNDSSDEMNNQPIIDSTNSTMFDEDIDWDVIIPDGFTEIPESMFYSCKEIHNVYLPDGIRKIGDSAFAFCRGLMHIRIPSSIEIIGAEAFNYCDSLKELIIPSTIKKIGKSAFSNCDNASIRFV